MAERYTEDKPDYIGHFENQIKIAKKGVEDHGNDLNGVAHLKEIVYPLAQALLFLGSEVVTCDGHCNKMRMVDLKMALEKAAEIAGENADKYNGSLV